MDSKKSNISSNPVIHSQFYIVLINVLEREFVQEIKWGEGEDHPDDELVEPKFEEIPGTLEHVTELMVEKVSVTRDVT